jgi:hypothetical protein
VSARSSHRRRWIFLGVAALVVAAAVDLPLAYVSSAQVTHQAKSLSATWARDQSEGITATDLVPLRRELKLARDQSWWFPGYWFASPQATLSRLRASTAETWSRAMSQGRRSAGTYLAEYRRFVGQNPAWLSLTQDQVDSSWPAELAKARTPGALALLSARWERDLSRVTSAVSSSEAGLVATVPVSKSGGVGAEAAAVEQLASADGLSELHVPQDAAALQEALSSGKSSSAASAALAGQIYDLQAEIGLDQQVTNLGHTVMGLVDQATFEGIPTSAALLSQYNAAHGALGSAQTVAQLAEVQTRLEQIQQGVQPILAAHQCGHSSYSGKSIYISISLEEMIFYDNGCAVNATPVTTGRPQLPTPAGTFSIFLKQSPVEFISPWPPSSPYYYSPVLIQYAMEFLTGGYYIHSAQWETTDDFGPGSQYIPADASHGCVHTPTSVMAWAYGWTPLGTPVVISS